MTKADLVQEISKQTGIDRDEVLMIVEAFMETVKCSLSMGKEVYLRGFGLSPNAKPDYDDNITTPESVAFSGTGPLSNTRFVWTAYWDAQDQNDKMFKWEFKGKGTTPSFGFIADCTFSK